MNVILSDEEYRRLIVLTYLGEWMVNAIRKDADPGFEDVASKVYSYVDGTSLDTYAVLDDNSGYWVAAEKLENEAHVFIDQYDDKTFWEELTARLTERDLMAAHGERTVRSMRPDQRTRAAKHIAQAYTKEFETQGLDRLVVDENNS